jgi:hypothetical protein
MNPVQEPDFLPRMLLRIYDTQTDPPKPKKPLKSKEIGKAEKN